MSRWMGTKKIETLAEKESSIYELDTIVEKNMEIQRKEENNTNAHKGSLNHNLSS